MKRIGRWSWLILSRGALVVAALAGISLLTGLIGTLISLPLILDSPLLFLPWLAFWSASVAISIDLFRQTYPRSLGNWGRGFLFYTYRIYGELAILAGMMGIGFALYLGGVGLQVISGVNLFVRWLNETTQGQPLLCEWSRLDPIFCTPTLWLFHLGHPLLAFLGLRYGPRLLDEIRYLYHQGGDWLEDQIR
jgi:hypothetical protein